jgi:ParB-like chromosome segregation protein Spo0J
MGQDITVEYIPLSDINPADKNPKDHDIGQIYLSMKRHGFVNLPLINSATDKLLAGHGRLETLQAIKLEGEWVPDRIKVREDGEWLVPCMVGVNIEDEGEALAYLVADNRLTEIGGYHTDELIDTINDILENTNNLDGTGFDLSDIEDMFRDIERDKFEVKEYGTDSVEDETQVQISIGRYKFKIPVEEFYDWEETLKGQLGNLEINQVQIWIKQQLGL